jgi:ubiquinone/menaquinone biosynthesis C-methylase UbiE
MSARLDVSVFDHDALRHGGYLYTTNAPLSSQLATQRTTEIIQLQLAGLSVLDIGCGDGFYIIRFFDRGSPRKITGIDASQEALRVASINRQSRPIQFVAGDARRLPFSDNSFDLALIQSILHHSHSPLDIVREAFRIAPVILIHEPNGNNLGLKVIEKLSRYHREHQEKSYTSYQMRNWIRNAGGEVTYERFAGFVPMFCPDRIAQVMKAVEPIVEGIPLLSFLACAVVVLVAKRSV